MNPDRFLANDRLLVAAVVTLLGFTLLADLSFPLGTAVWVIYLIPTVLAFASSRPSLPIITAVTAAALMIIGYDFAPDGIHKSIALTNRTLAILVNMVLAGIGMIFIRYRNENKRQEWLRDGEVGLGLVTAGDLDLPELGQSALSYIADRVGATAGALYVREDDHFRLLAARGITSGETLPAQIDDGDSLVALAAAERRAVVISDIPENYFQLRSSLGQGQPRQLLISATEADDMANAVIELGFFNHAGSKLQEAPVFLEQISRQLGLKIRSGKYRERLQALLAETQQQAEELQAQSEELRANNDELEAQSRSLTDAHARLEDQQTALEESNAQLEEQTRSLEAQRDELNRAQTALRAQTTDLEQASKYKSEFLANMSHELRTPLNSLLIMARLLGDNRPGNLSEEQVRFARTIETSGNDLLMLINDILDISKIEAGRLELQPRRVKLSPLLTKLEGEFTPMAESKGIALVIADGKGSPQIETDPQRLEQVLRNFVSNAIKFTEKGKVAVEVTQPDDEIVAFTVRDTGPGIPHDQQIAIFEAFRQADGTISRKYGGTGLGLSISRELARLLGGTITLDSEPGRGSAFTLTLPLDYDPATVLPATAQTVSTTSPLPPRETAPKILRTPRPALVEDDREVLSGDSRVILVVEDDPLFARILYDLAHEMGLQCLLAPTADEGALMVRQYLPNAVILDMNLPDHTGLSVLDRIKRDARTRHIPVYVCSVDDETIPALSSGAVGYLQKPVRREALVDMLEGLEARMAQRLRRVLVVEDDPQQAESVRHLLASRDVETVEAHSASDCLTMLTNGTYDCMVLDLNLPDMPGLDLLEKLSTDESIGFPPVIVYTGRDLSSEEELRLRRYSKSIIVKGAKSPERLLDEVTLFLHQVVSELPKQQQ